jgi:uncharacterized protein
MLAAEREVAALSLEAFYSSIADIAATRHWWAPVELLIDDSFDVTETVQKVRAPILFQHGQRDQTIPIRFARKLFDAAPDHKELIVYPAAGHVLGQSAWRNGLAFAERHIDAHRIR